VSADTAASATTAPTAPLPEAVPSRTRLGRRPVHPKLAFAVICLGLCLVAAQSAAPTPLYPLYADRWGLAPLATTAVFAAYVVTLACTLVVAGSLSDHVGRRPVATVALLLAAAAMVTLMTADGLTSLLVGRGLQGIASGLGFGTLGAAMLDHAPVHRHGLAGVVNTAMPPVAQGLGAVLSGVLVQFAPYRFELTYAVTALGCLAAALAVVLVPDVGLRRPGALRSLSPRLSCPPSVRPVFTISALYISASWAVLGLSLGIGPTVIRGLFGLDSPTVGGLAVLLVAGTGAVAGVLAGRSSTRRALGVGGGALVVGSLLIALAVTTESLGTYLAASVVAGAGFGASFQGGLRPVVAATDRTERSATLSLLYVVSYIGFGLPSLLAGATIPHLGLDVVVLAYAALVVVLVGVAAVLRAVRRQAH